jgi:type VI secretion system protein ImpK
MIRGDLQNDLAINWQPKEAKKQKLPLYIPYWLIGVLTLCCLGLIYVGFDYVLDQQTSTITHLYQQISQEQGHELP